MMRALWIAAVVVGFGPIGSARAIEIVNESNKTVHVCLHRHQSENVGANFDLYVYYWESDGWWTVKPGQTVKLPDGLDNSLCWMRLTFDSTKGKVITPAKPAAGPSNLPVHDKVFKIRRTGADKDNTWLLTIDSKQIKVPGRAEQLAVTAGDAVKKHGCWLAEGFYGYKSGTKFTVK